MAKNKVKILGLTLLCGMTLAGCGGNDTTANSSSAESSIESTAVASSESSTTVESSTVASTEAAKEESTGDFVDSAADATFDGTILKGNSYSIRITDHKVIPVGDPGNEYGENPVIAFWYDTMVAPDYDNSAPIYPGMVWMMNFNAVQDNDPNMINELNVGNLPDDQFLDTQNAEIKPGGTVPCAIAYELTDTETPVTLTAKDMMGTEYGSFDFAVK